MGPKLTFFILIMCTLAGCATSAPRDKNAALLHLRIGTAHLEKGNYPQALKELLIAEKFNPEDPVIQNNLGLAYFVRSRNLEAERHLLKALHLKSDYTEARNNLARVYIEIGQYDLGIKNLETVLADLTYPNPDKAWVNLGLAYFKKGQFNIAKVKLSEAIRINRGHCLAHTLYGRSLLELSDLKHAASALDTAVVLCRGSEFDEPHYYSALTYYKLGRSEKAVARMEELINLYPSGKYVEKAKSFLSLMR